MIFQSLYFLVATLYMNERLVKNVEAEGDNPCSCSALIYLFFFVLVTAANITWMVFLFLNFGGFE